MIFSTAGVNWDDFAVISEANVNWNNIAESIDQWHQLGRH